MFQALLLIVFAVVLVLLFFRMRKDLARRSIVRDIERLEQQVYQTLSAREARQYLREIDAAAKRVEHLDAFRDFRIRIQLAGRVSRMQDHCEAVLHRVAQQLRVVR